MTDSGQEDKVMCTFGRGIAVLVVALVVACAGLTIVFFMVLSIYRMQNHLEAYATGSIRLKNFIVKVGDLAGDRLPPEFVEHTFENAASYIGSFCLSMINTTLSSASSLAIGAIVTALYVMFWLCSPLPLAKETEDLIQRYIMLKTVCCAMYATCVFFLFTLLGIDLPEFFALVTFILNYIPEFGPIIAMLIPIPVILLDSRLPDPGSTLFQAMVGQIALKFFFGNVVEVKFIENDARLTMHPVITLFSVAFFGYIWGPTGMMLAVPLMGLLKLVVSSTESMPEHYRTMFFQAIHGHDGVFDDDDIALLLEAENDGTEVVITGPPSATSPQSLPASPVHRAVPPLSLGPTPTHAAPPMSAMSV
jgi:predicted PurR-regulated permease PerM